MKNEELQNELRKIIEEVTILQERQTLQKETVDFLGIEANKLIEKSKLTPFNSFEEEEICKQMEMLEGRLHMEIRLLLDMVPKIQVLQNRIEYLSKFISSK